MMPPAAVTVIVDGSIVPSSAPARVVGGRIVAPLTPIIVRLATRSAYRPADASVEVERAGRRAVVAVVFVEHDVPYVELAGVVRALGGTLAFDGPSKTVAISLGPQTAIRTPVPFDPAAPTVAPRAVFTAPRPEPPHGIDSGVPRPRRTAIPVTPSQPEPPAPETAPTAPRR